MHDLSNRQREALKLASSSTLSDASWIPVNSGTICIFNQGSVFIILTLQIGLLKHDIVYLHKKIPNGYVLIWLRIPKNVRNIYKPVLTLSYVASVYPRQSCPLEYKVYPVSYSSLPPFFLWSSCH